ncbi:unnamed protein product [Macrosiphum euphorbiae]|uniref:C2H2-type domain-containing protein n=2 Tax=Macrosiphini TaxID=33386 RepID=A0A8R1W6T2_ACYPI|nr:transcriptional regulator of yeast form adherence 4-like [Acyrthosiphon pisum]CAI6368857.1 unnamed protein product [Macrosiphum euphorbiae]|eukprot:XP_003246561.1 PREDICTED: transcriptional regulator of yeast form adherence 4-like [Acyrthosiphon pisum]
MGNGWWQSYILSCASSTKYNRMMLDPLTKARLQYWTSTSETFHSTLATAPRQSTSSTQQPLTTSASPENSDGTATATEPRFPCPKCPRSYRNRNHLYRHVRYECDRIKQYRCGICFKDFYRRDNLKTHINYKHLNKLNLTAAPPSPVTGAPTKEV